jgi:hypothetical protein
MLAGLFRGEENQLMPMTHEIKGRQQALENLHNTHTAQQGEIKTYAQASSDLRRCKRDRQLQLPLTQ